MRWSRLTGLDGLRALAVIAVVLFHADSSLLPGGFLGVDVFFVISGYLITRMLLAELADGGRLDLARFYRRRAVRLLPAVFALIAAVVIASAVFWRDETSTLRDSVLASLTYVTNWWLSLAHQSYFVSSGRPPMLQHLWSLAIEEQFYLVWPLVLVVLAAGRPGRWLRIGRRPDEQPSTSPAGSLSQRRLAVVAVTCLLLALASTALMAVIAIRSDVPYGADSSRIYYGTDTHSMGLLLGAAAGAAAEWSRRQTGGRWQFGRWQLDRWLVGRWQLGRWLADAVGALALVALAVLVYRLDEFDPSLYRGGFLLVSAVAVVVVTAVARQGSLLGRALDWAPMRWVGERSYAIYLWHWPVVVVTRPDVDLSAPTWVVLAIRIALPLALAEASYRFVERPLRRMGNDFFDRRVRRPEFAGRSGRFGVLPRVAAVAVFAAVLVVALALPGQRPDTARGTAASVAAFHAGPSATTSLPASQPLGSQAPPAQSSPAQSPTAAPTRGSAVAPGGPGAPGHPARPAPARPAPAKPAVRPAVSAFGDSVMLGAQPALDAMFPQCSMDAVEGQQPYVTLQEVRSRQAAGQLAPYVVIHTGNNGLIRPSDLTETLSQLRDRRRIVLLTDRVPRDWQEPNNSTIKQIARGFPNVVVLDWFARSNGNQSWFYADGLHLRPAGAAQYAAMIAADV